MSEGQKDKQRTHKTKDWLRLAMSEGQKDKQRSPKHTLKLKID